METAVILTHEPTGVEAEANECRSQSENRRAALFRLRLRLALTVRTESPPEIGVSELWRTRCRNGRMVINPEHADFPAILAEALDVLTTNSFEVPKAAEWLGCTASQLVKLLKESSPAFELLNRERNDRGLPRLR